jgi:hypothetical protein
MKKIIGKCFASIRQKLFNQRVNWEIFHKVFPHLNRHADHGYPFSSKDEMVKLHIRSGLDAQMRFDMIERTAAKMPKAYGDAFRYIAYRDLNERMKMYLEIAAERVQPETCDPRFVARLAT